MRTTLEFLHHPRVRAVAQKPRAKLDVVERDQRLVGQQQVLEYARDAAQKTSTASNIIRTVGERDVSAERAPNPPRMSGVVFTSASRWVRPRRRGSAPSDEAQLCSAAGDFGRGGLRSARLQRAAPSVAAWNGSTTPCSAISIGARSGRTGGADRKSEVRQPARDDGDQIVELRHHRPGRRKQLAVAGHIVIVRPFDGHESPARPRLHRDRGAGLAASRRRAMS